MAEHPARAHEDVEEPAPAGQHGGAGQRPAPGSQDARGRAGGGGRLIPSSSVSARSLNVRITPKAAELLRPRELTRGANNSVIPLGSDRGVEETSPSRNESAHRAVDLSNSSSERTGYPDIVAPYTDEALC
jgi:hypothetical protein